ncbi:NADH-quinone oxidoreductase subunit L, partial [bacterium]|nr:NADH-quinone oxidoreductase subunit L [bacterium]
FTEISASAHILRGATIFGDSQLTTIICLLFFGGAVAKSAQIPLYVWLPDAMAGPTPVSALIHAATMVTAGIYFIARNNVLFTISPDAQTIIATVAALTAFFAATIGLVQNDIKKVLAYSTVSQLGYMFIGVGVGAYSSGIFHLVTHAFFKALLFLGAGSVIHIVHHALHHSHENKDAQDIRNMGGLSKKLPLIGTYGTFLVAWLAICGIPPFAGFFSKDEILAKAWAWGNGFNLVWLLGFLGAILTAFYMTRLFYLAFLGETRMSKHAYESIQESPATMTFPLIVLGILSAVSGLIGIPHAFGGHNWFGETFLKPVFSPQNIHVPTLHIELTTDYILMAASVGAALLGIFVAKSWYKNVDPKEPDAKLKSVLGGFFYNLLLNKYYVDELYQKVVVQPIHFVSDELLAKGDLQILDGWLVDGTGKIFVWSGNVLKYLQTGYIPHYFISLAVGAVVIVTYFVF